MTRPIKDLLLEWSDPERQGKLSSLRSKDTQFSDLEIEILTRQPQTSGDVLAQIIVAVSCHTDEQNIAQADTPDIALEWFGKTLGRAWLEKSQRVLAEGNREEKALVRSAEALLRMNTNGDDHDQVH
ncbi:MAG: hypothetical protein AAGA28_06740 [Pseudomonadota bacterium]